MVGQDAFPPGGAERLRSLVSEDGCAFVSFILWRNC